MWHVLIVVSTVSGVTAFGTTTARALGHLPCVGVETRIGNEDLCLGPRDTFKDCPDCPEMVVVPAGSFVMGSPEGEPEREPSEGPQHVVKIGKPFAVGRSAVTRAEFSAFVTDTGHVSGGGCYASTTVGWKRHSRRSWRSPGIAQDDGHPVVCVSWEDARAFVDWLAMRTGKRYRLLSEAEWEYVARAGTTTPFWWGFTISTSQANYDGRQDYAEGLAGEWRRTTIPARSLGANPWGLYNVHGNVWEWVEDCWNDSYLGAPANESAWMAGDCASRVLRGGSWVDGPGNLRAASRFKYRSDYRDFDSGFRVARSLILEVAAVSPGFEGQRLTIVARRPLGIADNVQTLEQHKRVPVSAMAAAP
jgi:formylglycine-generating enzyme required for sulfatase activity